LSKEFFIWCDESTKKGPHYSNFYGGLLIKSEDLSFVLAKLSKIREELGVIEEIKWGKVDAVKLPAFISLVDVLFELINGGKIKIRIMFRQSSDVPKGLSSEQRENEYFILYYQFIKHVFGLKYSNESDNIVYLRLHFDEMPDTISKVQKFKNHIKGLERSKDFQNAKMKIRKDDIVEVDSKKHLPLQFLDVILGSMQFRLNNLHRAIPIGQKRRGKRTIAKEKLYKYILSKIREIKPRFNIGISTGRVAPQDQWNGEYRHWKFKPKNSDTDSSKFKK